MYITIWYVEGESSDFLSRTSTTLYSMRNISFDIYRETSTKLPIGYAKYDLFDFPSRTTYYNHDHFLQVLQWSLTTVIPSTTSNSIWNISIDIRHWCVRIHLTFLSWTLPFGMSSKAHWLYVGDQYCISMGTSQSTSSRVSTNTYDLPVMDMTIWYVKARPLTLCRGLVLLCIRYGTSHSTFVER